MFKGSIVALITPFRQGAVDAKGFQDFVEWQLKEGTRGLVPCGTTGRSEERRVGKQFRSRWWA